MTFVDTNVFMYAVGRDHPLREEARAFFLRRIEDGRPLVTSTEVLQELLHAYLPVDRIATLDAALELAEGSVQDIWSVEPDDVRLARRLLDCHPGLSARDLLLLACCHRRQVESIHTFDRALRAAFDG